MVFVYTKSGKQISENRTFKASPDYTYPSIFKIGINTDPLKTAGESDTNVFNEVPFSAAFDTISGCDTTVGWGVNQGTISTNTTTFMDGEGALNITKTATDSLHVDASKGTIASFTFDTDFLFWLYIDPLILPKISFFQVSIGQSYIKRWYWTLSSIYFFGGWNCVYGFNSSNYSGTSGAPTEANCVYFRLYVGVKNLTDVWTDGQLILDALNIYTLSTISCTNTIDNTNNTITITATLPKATFTTNLGIWKVPINEFGIFNSASKLFDHSNFPISLNDGTFDLNFEEQYVFNA